MSFFGGGSQPVNTGPSPLTLAKVEAEVMTEMFNKMATMCFKKCVTSYHDTELNVGEMTCVDRCVSKYMQSQEQVGIVLGNFERQMQAQQASGIGLQQPGKFGPGKV